MNQPQRILVVEIRTMDNPGLDRSQLSTLTAFDDSSQLYLSSNLESIKSAILDAIVHLGNNYRHPLLYNVQVIPGSEMDAMMASIERHPNAHRRRRKGKR